MKESKSRLLSNNGSSMYSVLGTMVVATLIIGGVTYSVVSLKSTAKSSGASDSCTVRAQTVIARLISHANKSEVTRWHPFVGTEGGNPIDEAQLPQQLTTFVATGQPRLPAGVNVVPPTGPVIPSQTNMWAMIESSYNWLGQLYNDVGPVCGGDGLALSDPQLAILRNANVFKIPVSDPDLKDQTFVKIERMNLSTNALDCTRPALLVPISRNVPAMSGPWGLKLTVTVKWKDRDNLDHVCRQETDLHPDPDHAPSVPNEQALAASTALNPAPGACGTPLPGRGSLCRCNNGICITKSCVAGSPNCYTLGGQNDAPVSNYLPHDVTYLYSGQFGIAGSATVCAGGGGTSDVEMTALSLEPATLFTCGRASGAFGFDPGEPVSYDLCHEVPGASYAQRTPATANQSGVRVKFSALPIGSHRIGFQTIDHARNIDKKTTVVNVMDPCPSFHTDQFCPAGPNTYPSVCGEPNVCPGTKPPTCIDDPYATACGLPRPPDICGRPVCGNGQGAAAPTVNNTFFGSQLDACGWCTITGNCVDIPDDPMIPGDQSVTCPIQNCGPGTVPPTCPTFSGCPTLSVTDYSGNTSSTTMPTGNGNSLSFEFSGLPNVAGCTMFYENAVDNTGNLTPMPTDGSGSSGPIVWAPGVISPTDSYTGTASLTVNCGGEVMQCSYGATCSGPSQSCNIGQVGNGRCGGY